MASLSDQAGVVMADRRPKIVLATDSLEPSGVGEHMLTLGQALSGEFEIVIAAFAKGGGERLLRRAVNSSLAVKALGNDEETTFWLQGGGAALLHVHAGIGWEGHALTRAGARAGLPVLRTEHLPFLLTDPDQIDEYRATLPLLAATIAVSEAAAQSFRAAGMRAASLHVVRNGIHAMPPHRSRNSIRAELTIAPDTPVLLTVARLTPQKGHIGLVEAFRAVLPVHPDANLLLVGEGPERPNVEAAIMEADLGDAIRLLGTRDDVPDLLAASDLFVLPSQFEGLPLALLEAMAAGLPAIATAIGGTTEALGADYPLLVQPGDIAALSTAMLAALADPATTHDIAATARDRFEAEFRADRMAAETARIYAATLNRHGDRKPMTKTRVGFIGAGGIANRHLGVLEGFEDVELAAFADTDLSRAEEAARRFGARAFVEHKAMLDAVELDALFICVPPFAHGEPEREAVARKLPFFVEKPISLDLALAEEIATAVARARLVTAVGYHWRYLDIVDEARRLLADNPAQLISGYWLDQTPPPQWWWRQDRSGGQVVEQTTHIIDLARVLAGEVTQVFGLAGRKPRGDFAGLDVATASTASLRFASGAIGNLGSTCLLGWSHRVGLHIFADRLALEISDREIMIDTGAGRPTRQAEGDPVWREDRDFIDAVRGGENRIRCPYGEALATHRVALAIVRSAETGQPVAIETPLKRAEAA